LRFFVFFIKSLEVPNIIFFVLFAAASCVFWLDFVVLCFNIATMKSIWTFLGISAAALISALPTVDLGYAIQQATINVSFSSKGTKGTTHHLTYQETGQYYNFSNIRYGAAPTGNLRFAAPVAPSGRNTTVNDGQTSVICANANPAWELITAQFLTGTSVAQLLNESASSGGLSLSDLPTPNPRTSEDCLFLDVMVPTRIFKSQAYKRKRSKGGSCKRNDCMA
jgi:hypothetical protein